MNDFKKVKYDQMILRVNWLGVLINIFLGTIKITVGFFAGSMAVFADGIHSLSDLATDFAVLIGTKLAAKEPDEKHPYGHEWYHTMSSLFISLVLVVLGCGMIYKSAMSVARQEVFELKSVSLIVVVFSIVSKEWLYRKTRLVAIKTHCVSLFANAWHHRSDALSSVAVLIGLISVKLGFNFGEQYATAAVGLMVILAGAKGLESSFRQFTDVSVDQETVNNIEGIIRAHPHVRQWHKLRTRTVGREIFLDFHILVDPQINITIAHDIAESLECDLHEQIDRPMNIIVHVEPDKPELRK